MRHALATFFALAALGSCEKEAAEPAAASAAKQAGPQSVGYDLRRLRPRNEEKLVDMFERMRTQAQSEGKHVAVLFSADWCEPCRKLELELGNMQPADAIGHVRILELKEEDWEAATRLDEFEALRARWYGRANSYPVFVVLDDEGKKIEEMQEAIERLEKTGVEPTVANWFRELAGPPAQAPG
jgi:thiol-disulfide isomerase/thioredoxin